MISLWEGLKKRKLIMNNSTNLCAKSAKRTMDFTSNQD